MRENRTYGSEGGEGGSLSRPLSIFWFRLVRFVITRILRLAG